MVKKIFRYIFTSQIIAFLITACICMFVFYGYFTQSTVNMLKNQMTILSLNLKQDKVEYLKSLENYNAYRITLIDRSGEVLYDNYTEEKVNPHLENHSGRQEVKEALEKGQSDTERYSATFMQKFFYVAQRLDDGSVLRLSISQRFAMNMAFAIFKVLLGFLFVMALISFFISKKLSQIIVKPVNSINFENPLENDVYEELSPFLIKMDDYQKNIRLKENELLKKQSELNTIIENLSEGMLLLDKDNKVITINHVAMRILQIEDECIGKNLLELTRNLDLKDTVEKAHADKIATTQIDFDGKIYNINTSCVMQDDELYATATVFFDVTQIKNQEKLRREFTANVSHQLKTPLQSILGYSELLKDDMVQEKDKKLFYQKIYDRCQNLKNLIQRTINLSRLDEGQVSEQNSEFNLHDLIKNVLNQFSFQIHEKNLKVDLKQSNVHLNSKKDTVYIIIENIIENAIKYNKQNGELKIRIDEDENSVTLTVKDTGVGVEPKNMDRIFERYYKVDQNSTNSSGLGLSIVKHSLDLINAKMDFKSKPNHGTTVTITFYNSLCKDSNTSSAGSTLPASIS